MKILIEDQGRVVILELEHFGGGADLMQCHAFTFEQAEVGGY